MDIPLPQVVPNVGPGGPLVTAMRGDNALSQEMMDTQIKNAQAQYAPYQAYGNAFLTNQEAQWTPYKYQMQALSNPLLWMAAQQNPALQQQLTQMVQNPLPGGGGGGAPNIPPPSPRGGLLGMVLGKMGLGSDISTSSGNPMASMPSPGQAPSVNAFSQGAPAPTNNPMAGGNQPNPRLPASGGPMAGAAGRMTAPYTESPYAPGSLIPDPSSGGAISVPTPGADTFIQESLLGAKRVEPQLDRLADEWSPFMDVKGMGKFQGAKVGNMFSSLLPDGYLDKLGLDSSLPSKYAKAKSTTLTAPEALVKAYGLNPTNETLDRLQGAIEPQWGENIEGYKDRIQSQLKELKREQVSQSQQALSQGFNVPPSPQQGGANSGNPGTVNFANGFDMPAFNNKDEFRAWYKAQNPLVQSAVRNKLGGK